MAHEEVGKYAYLAGIAASVLLPFLAAGFDPLILLIVLGLVVGYLNVMDSESLKFLVAVIGLPVAVAAISNLGSVGGVLAPILTNITAFAGGAAVVGVLMTIHQTAGKR